MNNNISIVRGAEYEINKKASLDLLDRVLGRVVSENFDSFSHIDFINSSFIEEDARLIAREKHFNLEAMKEIADYVVGNIDSFDYEKVVESYFLEEIPDGLCSMFMDRLKKRFVDESYDVVFESLVVMLSKLKAKRANSFILARWTVDTVGF